MNWDQIEGKWKQYAGKARERWGKLTDDDLQVIGGKKDQLVGKIQERYGIAREEAHKQVEEFARSFRSDETTNQQKQNDREDNTSGPQQEKAHGAGKR
jgi:uncharacterized protein YjbJ (UPF0337 family)